MNVRRIAAALTVSCACLASGQAFGQTASAYGPSEPARAQRIIDQAADQRELRAAPVPEREPRRPAGLIQSWTVGDNAQLGLGRFRVLEIARPRTNTERVRNPVGVARDTSAIAGAGLSVRFR
jgi:hypothetical protein